MRPAISLSIWFYPGTRTSDGDCADCYLITRAHVTPGAIVECEPFGLLEQDEDGEVDDKVLAALPAEQVEINSELLQELRDFICAVFAAYPDVRVQVGRILPREAALQYCKPAARKPRRDGRGLCVQNAIPSQTYFHVCEGVLRALLYSPRIVA